MHSPEAARVIRWIGEYGNTLLPLARAFALDRDEAEDILQEAWIVALRKGHAVRDPEMVGAWLRRVVLNVGRTRARNRLRRASLRARWLSPSPTVSPPNTLEEERLRQRLWRAVAALPELQQQVVILRVVEQMSTKEASEALNRVEGTIKASLHRALAKLRSELGRSLPEDSSLVDE
jgi:RNA polymerase sigma factor (sigma-70 family)